MMKTYEVMCSRCQRTVWPYLSEPPSTYVCVLCRAKVWKTQRKTKETLGIHRKFASLVGGYRVMTDSEGYPYVPGKYGRVEVHDLDKRQLAIYTEHPSARGRLTKTAGILRHQIGDDEFRFLFPVEMLPKVTDIIRARKRRTGAVHGFRKTR